MGLSAKYPPLFSKHKYTHFKPKCHNLEFVVTVDEDGDPIDALNTSYASLVYFANDFRLHNVFGADIQVTKQFTSEETIRLLLASDESLDVQGNTYLIKENPV